MNILFLYRIPMLPFIGGVQRVTENLTKEFISRGHKVVYLSIYEKYKAIEYDYPAPQYYLDYKLHKQNAINTYRSLLVDQKIDVIINQEVQGDLLELLSFTPNRIKIKVITCFHTQPFLTQGKTRQIMRYYKASDKKAKIYRTFCMLFPGYHSHKTLLLERKRFKNALKVSDQLCFESDYYIQRVKDYVPDIDVGRLVAVNNPNSFPIIELKDIKKDKLILWVGRHENTPKNVPLFVDFWTYFQRHNPEWKAAIIGVGDDLAFNIQYAEKKNVNNLDILGRVDDIEFFYKRASFLIMTSMYEGQPMVLLEAMNNGCIPCAFDSFESLHDIIDDGVNGIIVPCFNYRLMASRIKGLISDLNVLNNMRSAAINKTQNFTVEKIVDKWETIFNTL